MHNGKHHAHLKVVRSLFISGSSLQWTTKGQNKLNWKLLPNAQCYWFMPRLKVKGIIYFQMIFITIDGYIANMSSPWEYIANMSSPWEYIVCVYLSSPCEYVCWFTWTARENILCVFAWTAHDNILCVFTYLPENRLFAGISLNGGKSPFCRNVHCYHFVILFHFTQELVQWKLIFIMKSQQQYI